MKMTRFNLGGLVIVGHAFHAKAVEKRNGTKSGSEDRDLCEICEKTLDGALAEAKARASAETQKAEKELFGRVIPTGEELPVEKKVETAPLRPGSDEELAVEVADKVKKNPPPPPAPEKKAKPGKLPIVGEKVVSAGPSLGWEPVQQVERPVGSGIFHVKNEAGEWHRPDFLQLGKKCEECPNVVTRVSAGGLEPAETCSFKCRAKRVRRLAKGAEKKQDEARS